MLSDSHKILLIEDDADDAEMILYTLGKMKSFDIVHIDDSVQAVNYLFGNNPAPAAILLDLKMPKIDGLQILRKLKDDETRRHIPVIVMISSPEGRRYVESFGILPDGYVLKPVLPQQFIEALAQAGLSDLHLQCRSDVARHDEP